jgi:hypothetical protein
MSYARKGTQEVSTSDGFVKIKVVGANDTSTNWLNISLDAWRRIAAIIVTDEMP